MQKVLIVDDHDDIRQMIRLTLGGQYEVLEAPNAVEAEVIVRRDKPAAVVLDVMMPGEIDGYELCRRIKASPELRHIRVILVTARGQSSDLETGKSVGADSYYVKPFSPLALVRDIKGNL